MVTDVRPKQSLNADSPIVVTLFPISRDVRSEQPLNADSPIVVTLYPVLLILTVLGIIKFVLSIDSYPIRVAFPPIYSYFRLPTVCWGGGS